MKNDLPTFLANELEQRRLQNEQYSLRAFARDLELNHATLSLVMRYKRPVTKSLLNRISTKLDITPSEFKYSQNRNITVDISDLSKFEDEIKVIAFDNNLNTDVVESIIKSFFDKATPQGLRH